MLALRFVPVLQAFVPGLRLARAGPCKRRKPHAYGVPSPATQAVPNGKRCDRAKSDPVGGAYYEQVPGCSGMSSGLGFASHGAD